MRSTFALSAAIVLCIAGSACAPTASATTDTEFLNDLREINDPSIQTLIDAAPSLVVTTGKKVCSMLDQGYGTLAVKGMVEEDLHLSGQHTGYYAGLFAVYAVADYCPAHQADSGFNGQY